MSQFKVKESVTFEVWVVLRDSSEYHEGKNFNAEENRLFHFFCKSGIKLIKWQVCLIPQPNHLRNFQQREFLSEAIRDKNHVTVSQVVLQLSAETDLGLYKWPHQIKHKSIKFLYSYFTPGTLVSSVFNISMYWY